MEKYTLKLTEQEVRLVADALSNVPYKIVVELINKIQAQVIEQDIND